MINAREFLRLDTYETSEKIVKRHGKKCVVSCIDPAGERQVLLANIIHDGRNARIVEELSLTL